MGESQPEKKKRNISYKVAAEDAGMRIDRWCKHTLPEVPFGLLQKWLRKGLMRVDGCKIPANFRLAAGATISCPIFAADAPDGSAQFQKPVTVTPKQAQQWLEAHLLYEDDQLLVLNKPAGLPTQGGSGVRQSVDGYIQLLDDDSRYGRLRLVHRLDRDTSGLLLLARSLEVAQHLTQAFETRHIKKHYLALVVGEPRPKSGEIITQLDKGSAGAGKEKMQVVQEGGQKAISHYRVLDAAGKHLALLELSPETGRKHQLRVQCAHMGWPILGDGKYAGRAAFPEALAKIKQLHLHAWKVEIPRKGKDTLHVEAPLPAHMQQCLEELGLHYESR